MTIGCKTFAIIGGDKRQLFFARAMADEGYRVILGGFDKVISMKGVEILSPLEAAQNAEVIVLPLPCVNKEGCIPSAFSDEDIYLDQNLCSIMAGKKIFCGMKELLLSFAPFINPSFVYDYYTREDFVLSNAYVTAEGAVQIALERFEGVLNGAKCLVCGYGRIGKALVKLLKGFDAYITVSARSATDLTAIKLMGAKAIKTDCIYGSGSYDVIFSTVPALVFTSELLANVATSAVVIDLASGDGSVDKIAAKRLDTDLVHALSLPGKCAPKTAGEIIKNTVYTILEEENR